LLDDIDLGDLCAVTSKDLDQVVPLPLQRFADGSAPDAERGTEPGLRSDAARFQLQGNDHLLEASARLFGEAEACALAERATSARGRVVAAGALVGDLCRPRLAMVTERVRLVMA
jgi:hypothetical protein